MNLQMFDRRHLWHPLTQELTAEPPIPIVRAEGCYVFDEDGRAYIDLISSWWVNLHGHAHPKIAEAIYQQAQTLEHVIFAGFTHPPAVKLCQELTQILPTALQRFFFSDNGSTAVEVALKMAYQYWCNQGEIQRHRFFCFEGGYHGDTFGAMSVGQSSGFHDHFEKLFFDVETLPFPATWIGDDEIDQKEAEALTYIREKVQQYASEAVALIAEPLVQGARGMRYCRPAFMRAVVDIFREARILVIFDEIMTGFGRTGTLFAFEQIERVPDFLCLAKGLTGGFLPLALTVVTSHIYEAFLGKNFDKAFTHSHSYTANPLGCAAGLASLELLLSENTQEQIRSINAFHREHLPHLVAHHRRLMAPRVIGTIAAFNIDLPSTDYAHIMGQQLKKIFVEEGLLLRPLGNVVYLMPPYCVSVEVLSQVYDKMDRIFQMVL